MVAILRSLVCHRPAAARSRRDSFARRLQAWASQRTGRRWAMRPLAAAVVGACMGQAALAAPGQFTLPEPLQGTRTIRGKTFSFQPVGQNSVLGPRVEVRDAQGNLQSVSMKLVQTRRAGTYNWSSFDLGGKATFEIDMTAGAGSSALNRVVGSTKMSEIHGRIQSNGNVFLINPNGILFGKGAQVNVQGLVASTLDVDDDVFLNGLSTINTNTATFRWRNLSDDDLVTFDHPDNYVLVEQGAKITTPSGGRVWLMARKVENAGEITTPGGQTALLGGEAVYIKTPDREKLFASEVNPNLSVLRGFLFEVDNQDGEVHNLGQILTERGNATLMAHTVRQAGRIRATTSVQENGSVFLLARSGVGAGDDVRAESAGTLTLTAGSRIEVAADNSQASSGSVQMTMSRIELGGQHIVMEGGRDGLDGARITAPAANVNVRAELVPNYDPLVNDLGAVNTAYLGAAAGEGRFVMGKGAVIDVSGTVDTTASVARHFVTTELIRNGDLASNPFLKDGALKDTKVTYDTRSAPAVLEAATHQGYKDGIQTTAGERMAKGGQVSLVATGGVLLRQGSQIDVSGGKVTFTEAVVSPTRLLGADGKAYTVNNARTDVQVVAVPGYQPADATRFGNKVQPVAASSRVEAGYVQGGDGGRLTIHAPTAVLDGSVRAEVQQGARQRAGLDARAAQAAVRLGLSMQGNLLNGLTVRAPGAAQPPSDLWADPLAAPLPGRTSISADWFNLSGAGEISVASAGSVRIDDGAHLRLQRAGRLTVHAAGDEGVYLGGDITGAGAAVSVQTASVLPTVPEAGGITLAAGRRIDVAGDVVNQRRDGVQAGGAVAGGSVSLRSAAGLDLQSGSAIDVSGGATVAPNATVRGTRAGDITLSANAEAAARDGRFDAVHLDATLRGHALAGTLVKAFNDVGDARSGKLTLKVGELDIVGSGPALRQGDVVDGLVLGSAFFHQGGFTQFDLDGVRRTTVAADARIRPQVGQWQARTSLLSAATGSRLADRVDMIVQADNLAPTRTLALRSSGYRDNAGGAAALNGALTVSEGSVVDAGPRGSVTLSGGKALVVDGTVRAAGGTITTALVGTDSTTEVDARATGIYRFGSRAHLDVSGTTLLSATNVGDQRFGEVLAGGRIEVRAAENLAATTPVVFQQTVDGTGGVQQAQLTANGTQARIDVRTQAASGAVRTRRADVASDGGHISVAVGAGGAALSADLQARAGGAGAQGGSLGLTITDGGSSLRPVASLVVQQQAVASATQPGSLRVSADAIQAGGFAHLRLSSSDEIASVGTVNLGVAGDMTLDAPTLAVRDGGSARFAAAGRLARTHTQTQAPAAATGGGGQLTLEGGVVDVSGIHTTQGVDALTLKAQHEIRFHALSASRRDGSLTTAARQVTLDAPQVNVATATRYALVAAGGPAGAQAITVQGGHPQAPAPLSAGGSLTLKADAITVDGVLRAPFGQIELQAPSITLTERARVSVSGDGLIVPYGTTTEGGTRWSLNGSEISAPPAKTITLDATGGAVTVAAGAQLDLSAGGQLVGWEFVPGPGGSRDIFQGTFETGTFAIVPSVKGLGGIDPDLLAQSGLTDSVLDTRASRQITFGEGGPVPAGTYTVLPARYALLAGGYLIRRTADNTPLAMGQAITQANGAVRVGASVGTVGGALPAAPAASFEVLTRDQALRFSEITTTTFDNLLNAQADRNGVAAPRRAMDAGTLNIAAQKVSLAGDLAFKRAKDGRGGELNVASGKIQVGGTLTTAQAGDTLLLDVGQLNRTGVDSLLVGGLRSTQAADGSRLIDVRATEVTLANDAASALTLGDVILAGTERVAVKDGAVIRAAATSGSAEDITVQGDGALVRVSTDSRVASRRTATEAQPLSRERGEVSVGAGSTLAGGSLVVEGTRSTQVAGSAALQAKAVVIAADQVHVGQLGPGAADGEAERALVLSGQLLDQLAQADRLTVRAFGGITLADGADLSVRQALTLDTPELRQAAGGRNVITAGSVGLSNTTGVTGTVAGGTAALTLRATGEAGQDGHIWFRDGVTALNGAGQTELDAAGSVVFASRRVAETALVTQARSDGYADARTEDGINFTVRTQHRALTSGLTSDGDLTISARSITAAAAAVGQLDAGSGRVSVAGVPTPLAQTSAQAPTQAPGVHAATPGLGARIGLRGASVEQAGVIDARAGSITLQATTGDVVLAAGSATRADGHVWTVDGVKVPIAAGLIQAKADAGSVHLAQGAVLSASAAAGVAGAEAGEVRLIAQQGQVTVEGDIRLLSDAGQRGGALTVDAHSGPGLDALLDRLAGAAHRAAEEAGGPARHNAAQQWTVHQRDGQGLTLSEGKTLRAQEITLVADRPADAEAGGQVVIHGKLDASGARGGRVQVSAAGDLVLGPGATGTGAMIDASGTGAGQTGGDIRLASRDGVVRLQAGGTVKANGGTGGQGGSLTLRAGLRDPADADAATGAGNVKVTAVAAELTGLARVTVQGEERNEVSDLGQAQLNAVKARSEAFQRAAATQDTLNQVLNGRAAGATRAIQSAQVLQSAEDLTLSTAWNLTQLVRQPSGGQFVVQASTDTPFDLTVRTAGHLGIQASLSGGFINGPLPGTAQTSTAANTTINNALRVAPADLPIGAGASINLVAGADLDSADVMRTRADRDGSVRIGDAGGAAKVLVRSTTGDIRVAAAGDVVLENDQATVYTTGRLANELEAPGALGFGQGNPTSAALHRDLITRGAGINATRQTPFMRDGGSIAIQAGGSVRTEVITTPSFVSDWTFHKSDVSSSKSQSWWSRYDLFNMGVATFGGGDIRARAGADVHNMGFVTATSGYKDAAGVVRRYGGGSVQVQADGNIAGLMTKVGGQTARITAGLNIDGTAERGGASLLYENTQVTMRAAQDALVDLITEAGLHERGDGTNDSNRSFGITGLGRDASLSLVAVSGDLLLHDVLPPDVASTRATVGLLPSDSLLAAPTGSILAARLNQMPQDNGARLSVLAAQDLTVRSVNVAPESLYGNGVVWMGSNDAVVGRLDSADANGNMVQPGSTEKGRREPIRLVAEQGDVSLRAELGDAARIIAGRDVNLPGFVAQHQAANELTLIQAGRDVNMVSAAGRAVVRGPGDVLVVAGRDVNNALAGGLETSGNRENGALPEGSASLTVLAGVRPGAADYGQAEARYFHLLGGAGVADWAADLYAQLRAAQAGEAVPTLGSDEAQAYASAPFAQQLARARALVGDGAYDQAVLSFMQGREAKPALDQAAAMALLDKLPAREQGALIGHILAPAWQQVVAADVQRSTALAMAAQRDGAQVQALISYVARRTGEQGLAADAALQRFAELDAEHRLLFANTVLKGELIASGSAAAKQPPGEAKLDAYQRGMSALATVFPGSKPTSSLRMGSSSIKTQQNSDITVMTPHGGMNVGRLTGTADPRAAAGLGIVTTSGGGIAGVVRDSIEVNQSRVFVVKSGDMLLWASNGNIDAGKGSKTVIGAPAPVFRIVDGQLQVDTTGSFSGSGIATLDADSRLYLFAPRGEINAGEAGIKTSGSLTLDAPVIVGGNDIQIPGGNVAPPPVVGNAATSVGDLGQSATAAGPAQADENSKSAATPRRRLLLDFLGFGGDDEDEEEKKKRQP